MSIWRLDRGGPASVAVADRALSQAVIAYVLALPLGASIDLNPLNVVGAAGFIVLGSAVFKAIPHYRLYRQDTRAFHTAHLLCQQRNLPPRR
jgi:hypothetical protein